MATNRGRRVPFNVLELPYDFDSSSERDEIYGPMPDFMEEEVECVFDHFLDNYFDDASSGKSRRACAYQVRHGVLVKIRFPEWFGRSSRPGRLPTPIVSVLFSMTESPELPKNTHIYIRDENVDQYFNLQLEVLMGLVPDER